MPTQNAIGDFGESIFSTRISQEYIFKFYFLGEKAPIADFLLEIRETDHSYYCLFQVKSTVQGYLANGNLRASVSDDNLIALIKRPLPTYIAGVDTIDEIVYICPAFDVNLKYPSIPTSHKLDLNNKAASKNELLKLKQDIMNYWDNIGSEEYKSKFKSLL